MTPERSLAAPTGSRPGMADDDSEALVLSLDDPRASDPLVAGAKAAAIARARIAGLPALPGFVITTAAMAAPRLALDEIRAHWNAVSDAGARALVVRSSSALEDTRASSMAGRFRSIVGVEGWAPFVDAVEAVRESAAFVARTDGMRVEDVPIAVLVQPLLVPRFGGVMFGVDPVSGRTDRVVIAVVRGLPDALVSGIASGSRYETDPTGRSRAFVPGPTAVRLPLRVRRRLVRLGARCAALFGGPQDLEWALAGDGELVLLQSRPVTTSVAGVPNGPVYGPGPIAETFPDALGRLEVDLWATPLEHALRVVFDILGTVPRARLDRTQLVVEVGGRLAVDLDAFESAGTAGGRSIAGRIRTLRAAWRVGRLRAALPGLAQDQIRIADAALLEVPAPAQLTDRQLVAALGRFSTALESLHTYEMLVGLVLRPESARSSAQSVALRVLANAREQGLADEEIPTRYPITLALTTPRIGPGTVLPRRVVIPEWAAGPEDVASTAREALRLRVRWMHEVGARFAWELGGRLTQQGILDEPSQVRRFRREELESVVRGRAAVVPDDDARDARIGPRLPARFRLSDRGIPVPVALRQRARGTGAGGGTGIGRICLTPDAATDGAVLVVQTLDARLAPVLPRLGGLVAETGSVLAHLAILARELAIPTVVDFPDATTRWLEGTTVCVDGVTGAVTRVDDPAGMVAARGDA
jgi:phosphohistidine swiveling domain-containing protein